MKETIIFRIIKCIDIALIGIYYLMGGVLASVIIEKIFNNNIENERKAIIFIRTLARTALLTISAYFIRLIIKKIPFPLNGISGYDHTRLKERNDGGIIFSFAIIILQTDFSKDITNLTKDWFN